MPQRRITPEILARVKELRSQGVNITRITTVILEEFGKAFGTTTLKYWLEPEYKEKIKRRNVAYFKSRWRESSAFREKQRKYMREYVQRRRKEDPAFRERLRRHVREYLKRKKKQKK